MYDNRKAIGSTGSICTGILIKYPDKQRAVANIATALLIMDTKLLTIFIATESMSVETAHTGMHRVHCLSLFINEFFFFLC